VAQRYKAMGLQPGGENGTYFQSVQLIQGKRVQEAAVLRMQRNAATHEFVFAQDFLPGINYNSSPHSLNANMVYVGQAVFAPELKHNDFAGVIVRDKIAVVFSGAPGYFPTTSRAYYSSRFEKLKQLSERGAKGVLYVSSPDDEKRRPWAKDVQHWQEPGMRLVDKDGLPIESFPGIQAIASVNLAATKKVFDGSGVTAEKIFLDLKAGKAKAMDLPGQMNMAGATQTQKIQSRNVIGLIPGSDAKLSKEYVVYSAHLDHVGVSTPVKGDAIYNGALDNALGIGIMLESARRLSASKPKRSILFVAVTAEEKGLLGADYFAKNPTVSKKKLVANINTDMPIILTELKDIVPLGVEHSSLKAPVEQAAKEIGFLISADPKPDEVVFVRSDQFAFIRQGIPSVYVEGGYVATDAKVDGKKLQETFLAEHYHQPSDDLKQPIHYVTAAKMAAFNARLGELVASDPHTPRWNVGDFFGRKFAGQP
jgi:Zn-dependent M28 family amino/carboxypeptidase